MTHDAGRLQIGFAQAVSLHLMPSIHVADHRSVNGNGDPAPPDDPPDTAVHEEKEPQQAELLRREVVRRGGTPVTPCTYTVNNITSIDSLLQTAQALSVSRKRYFLEENEIVLIEGEKYAVTSQITTETANKLLSHLRPLGLKILENR